MHPSVGLVLENRYNLTERVATGGMGEVWRADDVVLGRTVAVKILKSELLDSPEFVARFRAEARHAAALSHPGIATVFDYDEAPTGAYLVMEFVPGETLAVLLAATRRPPLATTMTILAETADALAAAHAGGVIHRDVKPANVMITPTGKVKVTDFGIARAVDAVSTTAVGQVVGTPQYMSPEQASGANVSPATDIYSLGVIGYEMLAGRPPFTGGTPVALALAHVQAVPPPLPVELPAGVRELITATLSKSPDGRPASAAEFASRVRGLAACFDAPTVAVAAAGPPTLFDAVPAAFPATLFDAAPAAPVAGVAGRPDPTEVMPAHRHVGPPMSAVLHREARHRRRVWAMFAAAVVVVALVFAVTRDDAPVTGTTSTLDPVSTVAAGTVTVTPTPTLATATTTAPAPAATVPLEVTIDPAMYVGRDSRDVIAELEALGFDVTVHKTKSDADKDVVVAVEPFGPLPAGSTIEVSVDDGKGKPRG
jgi:tRNA A-37 threonylcarbamoyl transferase component Bud32